MKQHIFWANKVLPSILATLGIAAFSSVFSGAQAASLSFDISPFTGTPSGAKITLDDTAAGAGKIQVKIDVIESINIADLRGVFFNIADDSLLSGLSISGSNITQVVIEAGSVNDLKGGNNLKGGGTPNLFDVGLEIGTPGIGSDDIRSTVFTLSHNSTALSLDQFTNQSFGVRMTSVGADRQGSSKLTGVSPYMEYIPEEPQPPEKPVEVPEPSTTMVLLIGGLSMINFLRKKETAQAQN